MKKKRNAIHLFGETCTNHQVVEKESAKNVFTFHRYIILPVNSIFELFFKASTFTS